MTEKSLSHDVSHVGYFYSPSPFQLNYGMTSTTKIKKKKNSLLAKTLQHNGVLLLNKPLAKDHCFI